MRLIYNYFILALILLSQYIFSQDTIVMKSSFVNYYNIVEESKIDTNLDYFEIYDLSFINSYSNTYLTNIGLASKSNLHFLERNSGFMFNNAMFDNLIKHSDIKLINTKKHFTNLSFYSNMSKKNNNQVLRIFHTQNVTENFNVGLIYNMVSSKGEFQKQSSADNSVTVFTSYEGKKYNCSGNFIFNKIKNENNGGIDKQFVEDEIYIQTNIGAIPVYLYNSKSVNMNREVNFLQSFNFNLSNSSDSLDTIYTKSNKYFKISHKLKYQYSRLNYYNNDSTFYKFFYIDTLITEDSTFQNNINNTVYFDYFIEDSNKTQQFTTYYINELENFYFYEKNSNYINNGIGIQYRFDKEKKSSLLIGFKYYLSGRKINNFSFYAFYKKNIFNKNTFINASIISGSNSPDYFEENYYSNNLKWDTIFTKNKMFNDIDISIKNIKHSFELGTHIGVYDNMIYFKDSLPFDSLVMISPFQETHTFNYYSVYLKKDFDFKHFRINNKVAYQYSENNNVLSVPMFSAFNSTSFKFVLVKNVLKAEIGFDIYYYTAFNADNYVPATSMFYKQNEVEIGNYPKFDAFIKLKLKRARMFFKFEHANYGLMGTNYYAGINQPLAPRLFRFGVSWSFYD